jgi:endonuclease I
LWQYEIRLIAFTLIVDDGGVKYVGKENAVHLINALKEHYEVTEDWAGKLYCGISLEWDYKNGTVDLPMPGYIENTLHKLQHKKPDRPQHGPYPARTPQYGTKA